MSFGRNGAFCAGLRSMNADVTEVVEEIEETTAIIYQGSHFALLSQNGVA